MLQDFDDFGGPDHGGERLQLLRAELERRAIDGFIVPRTDEYQNEYVPANAEHLLWLTGFSGSWGTAIVLSDKAALFVDGRYVLQAATQVDPEAFTIINVADTAPDEWLAEHLRPSNKFGYFPHLHTIDDVKHLTKAIDKANATLVPVENNPVTAIWTDRPAPPMQPLELYPLSLAGRETAEKIAEIQETLLKDRQDAAIITALDSIAWLFNIRGSDLPHTPFVLSRAIVPAKGQAWLFIDGRKVTLEAHEQLSKVAEVYEPHLLADVLAKLGRQRAKVRLDPARCPQWFAHQLTEAGAEIVEERDPCILPKARKNATEIAGAHAAHHRDGLAMCRFLAWFDAYVGSGELDEITVAQHLEAFRREASELCDISFDTISGAGPHGAIVHYRVTRATNINIEPDSLFLIDSGGQYLDGTTDITRTLAVGTPSAEMRRHFTLVLKGHIAIATLRFPKDTAGQALDAFARHALWQAGLDYDHGTGHGVGAYLSVHEGPQGLSKRAPAALEPGMILSNEPGYYREGHYGIRIENLILVKEPEAIPGGDRPMMSFETLTLAPIDRRLINVELLSPAERSWVDAYHTQVFDALGAFLDETTRAWLSQATEPLIS
jgi:Xaa-Pro aminopeptidase